MSGIGTLRVNFYTFESLGVWVWNPKPVYWLQNGSGYGTVLGNLMLIGPALLWTDFFIKCFPSWFMNLYLHLFFINCVTSFFDCFNIFIENKGWVTYRFSYATRHNDTNKICVIPRISTKSIVFKNMFEISLFSVTQL